MVLSAHGRVVSMGDQSTAATVTEVEFSAADSRYPLVSLPERTGARVDVEAILPRGNCRYAVFYSFAGVPPDRARDAIAAYDGLSARILSASADGGVVEVVVDDPDEHFVVALCDAGAIPRDLWSASGVAHLVAEVPACEQPSEVVARFTAVHPTVELVARRERDRVVPLFTRREFEQAVDALLTPRQRDALAVAYVSGYFESPREQSAADLAAELGVSQPTFSYHLREAERRVLGLLFADGGL